MDDNKTALRKALLSFRKAVKCERLCLTELLKYQEFSRAKTVFCYVSAHGEVETHLLLEELLKEKRVVVPYCTDSSGNMICVEIHSLSDLKEGRFGILEPEKAEPFPKEKIDFAIVPGIAFDKNGYRLGYGKGYYDRFLADISPFKIGVCQKEFLKETLPHDDFDVKMDDVLVVSSVFS